MSKKFIKLEPIKPNWAIGNAYSVALRKMTNNMIKSVMTESEFIYKRDESEIEMILDESHILQVHKKFTIMLNNWIMVYTKYANRNVIRFINEVDDNVQRQLTRSLAPLSENLVVKFDANNQRVLMAKQASIRENVDLITNIPQKMKSQILTSVNESMSRGRDWEYLEQQLNKIGEFTTRRAKNIAKDQINKATSVVAHARQAELGITKNEWRYTYISKEPRQSHLRANGKIYDIAEGCKIDGEFIYPAQKIFCKCISAPVIEAFN